MSSPSSSLRLADHPGAARIRKGGLGRGAVAPVGARIADAVNVAERNVDPDPVILAAGFEQQNTMFAVSG